jgi:hypothetical protein
VAHLDAAGVRGVVVVVPHEHGLTELLAERLATINRDHALGMSPDELTSTIVEAVAVSNSDVQNFAYPELNVFLDNTWKLLPETNPDLHAVGVYSIRKFRIALFKTEGFLASLEPKTVFRTYAGVPSEEEFDLLTRRARTNLSYAVQYVGAKLLTMCILEALAEATGGDVPVAYVTGAADSDESQLQDYLPKLTQGSFLNLIDGDPTILGLLKTGRATDVRFDTTSSPVSALRTGSSMRDLMSISSAAISRYSEASSRLCRRISST